MIPPNQGMGALRMPVSPAARNPSSDPHRAYPLWSSSTISGSKKGARTWHLLMALVDLETWAYVAYFQQQKKSRSIMELQPIAAPKGF